MVEVKKRKSKTTCISLSVIDNCRAVHNIKPGTPELRNTEHRRDTGTLAELLEYHGRVEHVKSSGAT